MYICIFVYTPVATHQPTPMSGKRMLSTNQGWASETAAAALQSCCKSRRGIEREREKSRRGNEKFRDIKSKQLARQHRAPPAIQYKLSKIAHRPQIKKPVGVRELLPPCNESVFHQNVEKNVERAVSASQELLCCEKKVKSQNL